MIEPRLLKFLANLLQLLFVTSLFFSVMILVYMGIMYITRSTKGAEEVHRWLPFFVIGLVIVFLSFTIIKLIELFFK